MLRKHKKPKRAFCVCGVFWTKFEHFLSKTLNKEASPAATRKPRHPAQKFSSHFLICARRFFSSKRKRKLLCGVLLLTSRTAGLSAFCIRSGVAEFPPNPPSATPSLKRDGIFGQTDGGTYFFIKSFIASSTPPTVKSCIGITLLTA